jgi:hypothetical protein
MPRRLEDQVEQRSGQEGVEQAAIAASSPGEITRYPWNGDPNNEEHATDKELVE